VSERSDMSIVLLAARDGLLMCCSCVWRSVPSGWDPAVCRSRPSRQPTPTHQNPKPDLRQRGGKSLKLLVHRYRSGAALPNVAVSIRQVRTAPLRQLLRLTWRDAHWVCRTRTALEREVAQLGGGSSRGASSTSSSGKSRSCLCVTRRCGADLSECAQRGRSCWLGRCLLE